MYPYSPHCFGWWFQVHEFLLVFCSTYVLKNHELDSFLFVCFGFWGGILLDSLQNSNRFSSALQNGTRWVGNQTVNQVRQPWAKFGMKPNVNGSLARKNLLKTWAMCFVFLPIRGVDWQIFWGDFLEGWWRWWFVPDATDSFRYIGSKMAFVSVSVWER